MKKTLKITFGGLVALFFVMAFLPTYNQIYFYLKHISLYIILAILSIVLLVFFYRLILRNNDISNNKTKILQAFTIIFLGAILYSIGETQITYIDKYESPFLYGCTYYDEYKNILYSSQFFGECPELDNIVKTKDSISFSVIETSTRINSDYYHDDIYIGEQSLNVFRVTDISISYTTDNRLKTISILSSTSIKSDSLGDFHNKYYSLRKDITNTYSDDAFQSIYDYYFIELDNYNLLDIEDVVHYNFTDADLERKIVNSNIIYDSNNIGHITLTKLIESEENEKVFGTGFISILTDEEYEKEITLTVEDGSTWDFAGHDYKTYISDNKMLLHNNFFLNDHQWVEYEYNRFFDEDLIPTRKLVNGFSDNIELNYEIYKDNRRNYILIEDSINLITIEDIEHGYLLKNYYVHPNYNNNDIGVSHPDWYYWNSTGYSLIDLYDYEHEIFKRSPFEYSFFAHNPLIHVYYD